MTTHVVLLKECATCSVLSGERVTCSGRGGRSAEVAEPHMHPAGVVRGLHSVVCYAHRRNDGMVCVCGIVMSWYVGRDVMACLGVMS